MGLMSFTVGVSFARTPLADISAKAAELEALGWHEIEDSRGNPWAASFNKNVPEEQADPAAEVRAVMGDAWVDADEMRALNEAAASSRS